MSYYSVVFYNIFVHCGSPGVFKEFLRSELLKCRILKGFLHYYLQKCRISRGFRYQFCMLVPWTFFLGFCTGFSFSSPKLGFGGDGGPGPERLADISVVFYKVVCMMGSKSDVFIYIVSCITSFRSAIFYEVSAWGAADVTYFVRFLQRVPEAVISF